MIQILYTKCESEMNDILFYRYLKNLPKQTQNKILQFKTRRDAALVLLGRLLLRRTLEEKKLDLSLSNICYSSFGRPYFEHSYIDFNISHSNEYVVCALSMTQRIGVDIEKIAPLSFSEFKSIFSAPEWRRINLTDDPLRTFYQYWTAKEAAVKADGRGLSISLENVLIKENAAFIFDKKYELVNVNIDENYFFHLACADQSVEIQIKEVNSDFF